MSDASLIPFGARWRSRSFGTSSSLSPIPLRLAREYIHQLERTNDRQRLDHGLSTIPVFVALDDGESHYEVLRLWSGREANVVAGMYLEQLEEWRERGTRAGADLARVLGMVDRFFEAIGAWRAAEMVRRERLNLSRHVGDRAAAALAMAELGDLMRRLGRADEADHLIREAEAIAREIGDRTATGLAVSYRGVGHRHRGEYARAIECYREAEEITREIGDRHGVAIAVGNRGICHFEQGEYAEAMACYREAEAIGRELGDRLAIVLAVSSRGSVHHTRGEYDEASTCFMETEAIARELGDRKNIAASIGNRGIVHYTRCEYEKAMACFVESESIARELGDRRAIAACIGNRGFVHTDRGEYAEALACCREQEAIARELGDRVGLARVVGNRGIAHRDLGEYAQALACLSQADDEHRSVGFSHGRTYWLDAMAGILVDSVESSAASGTTAMPEFLEPYIADAGEGSWQARALRAARALATECLEISRDLSKSDTLFEAQLMLARIDAAEEHPDAARQMLAELLASASDDEQRAEAYYWLWKVGERGAGSGEREEALALYRQLVEKAPKYQYGQRIAELSGGGSSDG